MIEDLAESVEPVCRAALRVDAAAGSQWFRETALSRLLAGASESERVAIAAWIQREVVRQHRRDYNPEGMRLSSAVWQVTPPWPAEMVAEVLARARDVVSVRPFNSTYLLGLPYAATNELTEEQRSGLAGQWRWFADRADLLGYMWPGPRPDLALIIERLLPAEPGSNDPERVFSDRCPLAARLRSELPLTGTGTGELLGLCQRLSEGPPVDRPALLAQVEPLLAADGYDVLRKAVLVALAHQPVDANVWVRGRQERRRIWCRPSTARVLGGALLVLATLPEAWVDPLLGAIGTHAVLFHPARLGRRPPLLTDAVRALLERKTPAAAGELSRMYAAYPEELRHWRWVIEKRLRR